MAGFAAPAPRVIDAAAADFTLEQALDFPFPDHLIASPTGSTIAWTFAERGVRNIYVAAAPDFSARRVTPYTEDDGQELTNLAFSPDGGRIVYVRGGDHGANWPAEGNLQPNPNSRPSQPKMQVWSVSVAGGAPVLLGDGDEPAIAPAGGRVAFVNNHRIWTAPLDGAAPAEQAFFARGCQQRRATSTRYGRPTAARSRSSGCRDAAARRGRRCGSRRSRGRSGSRAPMDRNQRGRCGRAGRRSSIRYRAPRTIAICAGRPTVDWCSSRIRTDGSISTRCRSGQRLPPARRC
jgi:hypothetical protein